MTSYGRGYETESLNDVLPVRATSVGGRAFLERRCVHVADIVPLLVIERRGASDGRDAGASPRPGGSARHGR